MITYSFTDIGSDSLYEHLYKCIKNDIIQGVLLSGEKLPSKRSFARNLGISVITVENAYAQLISEGYIYSLPKKGFYVADFNENLLSKKVPEMRNIDISSKKAQKYWVDFSNNQTPSDLFPFTIWTKLLREILSEKQSELMTNSPSGGVLLLKQAIAEHLKDFRGMQVLPEQIIIGAGTEYLYGLIVQLLGMDKKYGVENPGYKKVSQIYQNLCVPYEFISMDESGVKISELEAKKVDVIHTSPSHHFPTGIVMPISRRYELLAWAAEKDSRYIIEDDYDSELRLCGQPIPMLQSIDVAEKVIYMNTFAKTLSSTIRISYMVLPAKLLEIYHDKLSFYSCTVSNFEQYTLAKFIKEGYFEKHINRMRKYYQTKRDIIFKTICQSKLNPYITVSKEDAGLHFLLNIKTDISDNELIYKLKLHGIKITSLSEYYAHNPEDGAHVFIINYSAIEQDKIENALKCIYEIIK